MTIRHVDGFDYFPLAGYGTLYNAVGIAVSQGTFAPSNSTAFGYGNALRYSIGGSNFATVTKWLRGRYTGQYIMGMRMLVPTSGAGYRIQCQDSQSNASSTVQWMLSLDSQGQLDFQTVNGSTFTRVALTRSFTYQPGVWFYLEIKVNPHLTAGSVEIRINTVVELSMTGIRTANGSPIFPATAAGVDFLRLPIDHLNLGAVDGFAIDDFYFVTCDGSVNNDYLGNVRIKYMAPVSQSMVQFTIGGSAPAATNWQSVLNSALDDTKYVYASTVGFKDQYGLNPVINAPTVFGIQVDASFRQDDATQRFAKSVLRSAGVDTEGASHALNQNYSLYGDVYELNPATGVAFTGAEANAVLIGPKVDV